MPKRMKTSNKITILDLPDKALELIASNLSQIDTLELQQSNKRFRTACRKRLYHKIVFCEDSGDHFLFKLADAAKYTIVSGKRVAFFFLQHRKLSTTEQSETLDYIQELVYYDHEDLKDDVIKKIMNEFWHDVMNQLHNLKSFIAPRLPLQKLRLLDTSRITKLSIGIHKVSDESKNLFQLHLPELKSLAINFFYHEKRDIFFDQAALSTLIKALINGDSKVNTKLEVLKINALVGWQDEHTISELKRQENILEVTSLFSSYFWGSATNVKLSYRGTDFKACYKEYVSELIDSPDSGANLPLERIIQEENNEIFQHPMVATSESANTNRDDISKDDYPELEDEPYMFDDQVLDYVIEMDRVANVTLKTAGKKPNYSYSRSIHEVSFMEILSDVLNTLFEEKIILPNVKTLNFSNMNLNAETFYRYETPAVDAFNFVFPNFYETIERLSLNDLFENPYRKFDNTNRAYFIPYDSEPKFDMKLEVFEKTHMFLSGLIDTQKPFNRLKSLKFFCFPRKSQIHDMDWNDEVIDYSGEELDNMLSYEDMLIQFTPQAPYLEELNIVTSVEFGLKEFYKVILKLPAKNKLERISFISPDMITTYLAKISNVKVFKKFKEYSNLYNITNYQGLINKILIEHFIEAFKVDDYEDSQVLSFKNDQDALFFASEYIYLFGNEVKEFFKICSKLEKFKFFGFTFDRSSLKL
ncbi:hypothetical protein BN7_3747 [Wickerhamomyces ciferrii]|uniref:F-box domain-containing protein n=1 Tax=Wickerhamomyces ciferrii (strain ATCC 14091 / BCRC 22168 / CBS 111 / JCM 3599 / NBRC 0793 / NRRL Y-1031 F-60-10) TaxID=1206466 RepID=K0KS70_WICCF|nr:uncharacterized protein BN7_3747 [Wickerhamomyces ciferrii]CCH44188.1 hypothetical protein BN7_3747 [Wickerhamomyces ciferrii]